MSATGRQDENALGVVVVSLIGGDALRHCLSRITEMDVPCVVMPGGQDDVADLKRRFPSARFAGISGQPVPVRRLLGVQMMETPIVAIVEDSSVPGTGWESAVLDCFRDAGTAAAGGPVCLAGSLAGPYLALGCGEYGRFHPARYSLLGTGPVRNNGILPVTRLPGNNLAYRRDILLQLVKDDPQGLIEGSVNDRLREMDFSIVIHPAMSVSYAHEDRHGAQLKTRFQHGRLFAGNRVENTPLPERITWALKSAVLPLLLTARGISSMRFAVSKSRWPLVIMWIFLMESAWSMGELTGYLRGRGSSLEAWS